eukprot:5975085-Pleurochrysis_carterae.AAC.1
MVCRALSRGAANTAAVKPPARTRPSSDSATSARCTSWSSPPRATSMATTPPPSPLTRARGSTWRAPAPHPPLPQPRPLPRCVRPPAPSLASPAASLSLRRQGAPSCASGHLWGPPAVANRHPQTPRIRHTRTLASFTLSTRLRGVAERCAAGSAACTWQLAAVAALLGAVAE